MLCALSAFRRRRRRRIGCFKYSCWRRRFICCLSPPALSLPWTLLTLLHQHHFLLWIITQTHTPFHDESDRAEHCQELLVETAFATHEVLLRSLQSSGLSSSTLRCPLKSTTHRRRSLSSTSDTYILLTSLLSSSSSTPSQAGLDDHSLSTSEVLVSLDALSAWMTTFLLSCFCCSWISLMIPLC